MTIPRDQQDFYLFPAPLIKALINLFATISNFEHELAFFSQTFFKVNLSTDQVRMDPMWARSELRPSMIRLKEEEVEEWEKLVEQFPVVEEVLELRDWREGEHDAPY